MGNTGETPRLTARQEAAIDAIASGLTVTRAAEVCGVSRRSLYNWLALPHFAAALERRKQDLRQRVADAVADLGVSAIEVVRGYLGESEKPGMHRPPRVGAAIEILEKIGLFGATRPDRGGKPESR